MSQDAFNYLVWLATQWQSKEYWTNLRYTRIDLEEQWEKILKTDRFLGYEALTWRIDELANDCGSDIHSLPTLTGRESAVDKINEVLREEKSFGRAPQLYAFLRIAMVKLRDLEDYVRTYIPESLRNIPIVDFFGDQCLDIDQVVNNMRSVECDARCRGMELRYTIANGMWREEFELSECPFPVIATEATRSVRSRSSKREVYSKVMMAIGHKMTNPNATERDCAEAAGISPSTLNKNERWSRIKVMIQRCSASQLSNLKSQYDARTGEFEAVDPDESEIDF